MEPWAQHRHRHRQSASARRGAVDALHCTHAVHVATAVLCALPVRARVMCVYARARV